MISNSIIVGTKHLNKKKIEKEEFPKMIEKCEVANSFHLLNICLMLLFTFTCWLHVNVTRFVLLCAICSQIFLIVFFSYASSWVRTLHIKQTNLFFIIIITQRLLLLLQKNMCAFEINIIMRQSMYDLFICESIHKYIINKNKQENLGTFLRPTMMLYFFCKHILFIIKYSDMLAGNMC